MARKGSAVKNHIISDYLEKSCGILREIAAKEENSLKQAAEKISNAYLKGHGIYVFGCTHSAILAEDVFYRAGAPAFWRPLWGPGMNITSTPGTLTSAAEKNEELGRDIVRCSRMEKDDVIVILSTSGKNAAPLAVAEEALKRGVSVIAVCSSAYKDQKGNHSSLQNFQALKDRILIIDNHVPCGDACLEVESCRMGPLSTIAGSFIMHTLSALAVERIVSEGKITPPVFLSSNVPGGLKHNLALMSRPEMKEAFLLP